MTVSTVCRYLFVLKPQGGGFVAVLGYHEIKCLAVAVHCTLQIAPIIALQSLLGFDSVHFGVFVVATLLVGFITPPVGIDLFVASVLSGEPFMRIAIRVTTAFVVLIVICVAIAIMSSVILWFR
ncbi:MAG: TRAP transporter large permease subunit [Roseobacter sp.]